MGQHVQNKSGRWGEECKRDHPVDLPAKMETFRHDAGASHQHQATHREVARQRRELAAEFGQIDFQAGEKKKRGDPECREIGDDSVGGEWLEKAGHNDAESKARELGGQTEALQRARDDKQAENHGQVDKSRARVLHSRPLDNSLPGANEREGINLG